MGKCFGEYKGWFMKQGVVIDNNTGRKWNI
jgi:hypothetical protein